MVAMLIVGGMFAFFFVLTLMADSRTGPEYYPHCASQHAGPCCQVGDDCPCWGIKADDTYQDTSQEGRR